MRRDMLYDLVQKKFSRCFTVFWKGLLMTHRKFAFNAPIFLLNTELISHLSISKALQTLIKRTASSLRHT